MTKGDLIYCHVCQSISIDNNELRIQDSRFNPFWNYRCGFCHGFKTVNASQFLDSGKTTLMIPLGVDRNPETLKAYGRGLKAKGIIKEFRVQSICHRRFKLYERRRIKRDILKALKIWGEKEDFK